MDILLVTDAVEGDHPLFAAANTAGCRVLKQVGPDDEASRHVQYLRPDAMVVVSDEMDRDILREMKEIRNTCPLPVLVFTRDNAPESISQAVKAGASSYIVDCNDLGRLGSLLEVARAKFGEQTRLESELDTARQALEDRKLIDKAKGIVMKQRNVSEQEAYNAMRKVAMNKNRKLSDIAQQIITAAEMLV
ncbi:MAG: ANTAR domain-containing response regulator [bacterium]